MADLQDEANLAAMALIRQAIEFSEAAGPAGSVMDVMEPYLKRAWELEGSPAGAFDAQSALFKLLASLAQMGGVSFAQLLSARAGRVLTRHELLAELDATEYRFITEGSDGR